MYAKIDIFSVSFSLFKYESSILFPHINYLFASERYLYPDK